MRTKSWMLLGLPLVLGLPATASAETDFLTVKKIACAPERMLRCKAAGGECESKEVSASDKSQLLVIDFTSKKATMRRDKAERPFGVILEDKVEAETRSILLSRNGSRDAKQTAEFKLCKDGKMEGSRDNGRIKMEITCSPEA